MFDFLRRAFSRKRAPVSTRIYHTARPSRLMNTPISNSSADAELRSSLVSLRSQSRALRRDASYAKRAKLVIVNNIVGQGIGLQGQVRTQAGKLNALVNDAIEEEFKLWARADSCHTGGSLHLHDFERALMGEVFEAGEALVRFHYKRFGKSRIPLALELIEAERIADDTQPLQIAAGNTSRMGIEVDSFYRPVAVWLRERHPSEFQLGASYSDRYERVPADDLIHLRVIERWPQTRGEPWLHTVIRKLSDVDGYSEAELVAARGAAAYMATIETPEDPSSPLAGNAEGENQEKILELAPGIVAHLAPGEKINWHSPNRPNSAIDPFTRLMLREIAAGTGVSYESLSRDYSQSNYSSSRLALLDDRDLWRVMQAWFIRSFREPLHGIWLQQAILSRTIPSIPLESYLADPMKYAAVKWKPRGWSWIDPTKEVEAAKRAVRNGFTTTGDVIAQTGAGLDLEDVLEGRKQELELMREMGLTFDTDPELDASGKPISAPAEPAPTEPPADPLADGEGTPGEQEGDEGAGREIGLTIVR